MFKITDENVIGGNKIVTPYGSLQFETVLLTDDEKIANYFKNKIGYAVSKIEESEGKN